MLRSVEPQQNIFYFANCIASIDGTTELNRLLTLLEATLKENLSHIRLKIERKSLI